jgi:hypothetical protein
MTQLLTDDLHNRSADARGESPHPLSTLQTKLVWDGKCKIEAG